MLITTVAAALLSITSAPQPTATPTPIAAPVAPAPVVVAAAPARANPRVCLVDEVTGSRLPIRTCKSLDQWRALGLDPLAKR